MIILVWKTRKLMNRPSRLLQRAKIDRSVGRGFSFLSRSCFAMNWKLLTIPDSSFGINIGGYFPWISSSGNAGYHLGHVSQSYSSKEIKTINKNFSALKILQHESWEYG